MHFTETLKTTDNISSSRRHKIPDAILPMVNMESSMDLRPVVRL